LIDFTSQILLNFKIKFEIKSKIMLIINEYVLINNISCNGIPGKFN
jgi:hypothetical protein